MSPGKTEVQCTLIAEFADRAIPANTPPQTKAAVVRPGVFHWFSESAQSRVDEKSFTVLLRGHGNVTVRGHELKYHTPGGVYAVVGWVGGREITVALFPQTEVTGIFVGSMSSEVNPA